MSNFNAYGKYYDLLYRDKDYTGEALYVSRLIQQWAPGCSSLLELGSGSGNHAAILCQQGMTVTGVERSQSMIDLAKSKNIKGFTPVLGDISTYRTEQTFGAAISLFHVVSYLTGNEALLRCFRNTHEHLEPGGIFIFDVWYTPAVYSQQPVVRIKRMGDAETSIVRIAEPIIHHRTHSIDVNFEVAVTDKSTGRTQILTECHPMRHFGEPEVALLAEATGFEVLVAEEFGTGRTPGPDTWGVCFVLKKKTT